MNTLIISLPDDLKKFLDEQVAKGEFSSYSDFMEKSISKIKNEQTMESMPNDFPFDPNLLKVFSTQGTR